jgi:Leucine-rich repeat (LRR) protein
MPEPLYTFEDLQTLEKFQPKVINGTFTFNQSTVNQQFIDLSGNNDLRNIEFACFQPNLRYLDANRCSLQSFTIPAGCKSLEMLYLQSNQLKEIIFEGDCPKLELLDLSDNQLSHLELTFFFPKLQNLFLNNNKLVDISLLGRFAIRPDFDLSIEGNKELKALPKEIVEQGEKAILNYFAILEDERQKKIAPTYNFEVKLLIIGEGGTGKTTPASQIAG